MFQGYERRDTNYLGAVFLFEKDFARLSSKEKTFADRGDFKFYLEEDSFILVLEMSWVLGCFTGREFSLFVSSIDEDVDSALLLIVRDPENFWTERNKEVSQ